MKNSLSSEQVVSILLTLDPFRSPSLPHTQVMDYPEERDAIIESLEAIEEQLTAVPHKREEVKDQLQTIAQAKRTAYPIANLYANVWSLRGRKARASREILSSLHLDPDLADHLDPGMEVTLPNVDAGPYEDLTLHGTVSEDGAMKVLDVERLGGTTLDRDEWMGRYHDYFGLLLTIHVALNVDEGTDQSSRERLHPHTPDHIERPKYGTLMEKESKSHAQTGDLRWETEQVVLGNATQLRYWTERIDRADGASYDQQVSVEAFDPDRDEWRLILEYNGVDTQFYRAWPLD